MSKICIDTKMYFEHVKDLYEHIKHKIPYCSFQNKVAIYYSIKCILNDASHNIQYVKNNFDIVTFTKYYDYCIKKYKNRILARL